MTQTSPADVATTEAAKPLPERQVLSSRIWQHAFGEMLIETCADGSVWIDGKPVRDTIVPASGAAASPMRSE